MEAHLGLAPPQRGSRPLPGILPQVHVPEPPEHIWLHVTSMKASLAGGSRSTANTDTAEHREGREVRQEQGKYQAIFTKTSAYLVVTTNCTSLSIHIRK